MKNRSSEQVEQILHLTNCKDDFDAIVAFGYGPVEGGSVPGTYRLNLYGRLNAIATGLLYQSLNINEIIPTGGKTGGSEKPSEAALMARIMQSKFAIPASLFTLEEEAMDTIYNLVHVANIIDTSPKLHQNLLFVAMGFHLPRIQSICSLVNLNGSFIAAESVVKLQSKHHENFLRKILHPDNPNYAMMIKNQERGLRGIRELPEYWIPPLGSLKNSQRLQESLVTTQAQSCLQRYHIDTASIPTEELQEVIRLIPRQFPN
jgi:hypothetical protein